MNNYLVATIHPWNIEQYYQYSTTIKGNWNLITERSALTPELVNRLNPDFIFFPHWSWKVTKEIYQNYPCVCFHMTDLPFGQGGSPLQNLIIRGITQTKVSALKMSETFDSGPIFAKSELSLHGSAEDIFRRTASVVTKLIKIICIQRPSPQPQNGKATLFERRTPEQSEIPNNLTPQQLYDFIRMLDAPSYPKAFSQYGNMRLEFSCAQLINNKITANVNFSTDSSLAPSSRGDAPQTGTNNG